jgi:hypothetical protein
METTRLVRAGAGALFLSVALVAGCNTPASICNDQRDAYNAAYARCGIPFEWPVQWLVWGSGPCAGLPATCDDLSKVTEPARILNECIPALETYDCDALAADLSGPSSCDVSSAYKFLTVEGDHCGG